MTNSITYRGHIIIERYAGEGITFDVVLEHTNGILGGTGSHGSRLAARAEVDGCMDDRRLEGCRAEFMVLKGDCRRCFLRGVEIRGGICATCGDELRDEVDAEEAYQAFEAMRGAGQ